MHAGPSKFAEAIVAFFLPPACREEVLGDLYERYASPRQYASEALWTVPLVIVSRIRRTADPQVLVMQALAFSVSFLGAAWLKDPALLREQWGLLRLAIPAGMALAGLMLADAYSTPGRRSPVKLIRGPVIGLGLALLSQSVFWTAAPELAVPRWIELYGSAMSLLLSSAIRIMFRPVTDQLQGANAPALWLKQAGGPGGVPRGAVLVFKSVAAVVAASIAGKWMADQFALPKPRVITSLLLLFIAYQLWKRG